MKRSPLRNVPRGPLLKVLIFSIVAATVSLLITSTLRGGAGSDAVSYHAVFSDASGLRPGDDVRVAGVKVGRVDQADLLDSGLAKVTFSVAGDTGVMTTSRAEIRYQNLIGQRYIALGQGSTPGDQLKSGATIPLERTKPAIDLTLLFNGLQPLLTTLSADEINDFGAQLIRVMQGEGGTIVSLLERTAVLSKNFADRDAVFGEVIANMNALLASTDDHKEEVAGLIIGLETLTKGVADQRASIFASLDGISKLISATSSLLHEGAPYINRDLARLDTVAAGLVRNTAVFMKAVAASNIVMLVSSHVMGYGEWWNLYICNIKIRGSVSMEYEGSPHSNRCLR